jgi:hypothetical protein
MFLGIGAVPELSTDAAERSCRDRVRPHIGHQLLEVVDQAQLFRLIQFACLT